MPEVQVEHKPLVRWVGMDPAGALHKPPRWVSRIADESDNGR